MTTPSIDSAATIKNRYKPEAMTGNILIRSERTEDYDIAENTVRAEGHLAKLPCGYPAYYSRRGFLHAERSGIRTHDDMYADALQVCPLRAVPPASWRDDMLKTEPTAPLPPPARRCPNANSRRKRSSPARRRNGGLSR